jgi:hypothetical protein
VPSRFATLSAEVPVAEGVVTCQIGDFSVALKTTAFPLGSTPTILATPSPLTSPTSMTLPKPGP